MSDQLTQSWQKNLETIEINWVSPTDKGFSVGDTASSLVASIDSAVTWEPKVAQRTNTDWWSPRNGRINNTPEKLTSSSTLQDFQDMLTRLYASDVIKNYAMKLTSNKELAEDLISDSYVNALTNILKKWFWWNGNYNMKAWFITIIRNCFINQYRKKVRENTMPVGDKAYLENIWWSTSGWIMQILELNEVQEHLGDMSDDMSIPVDLHAQGYKYKEIAAELDLPLGTTKSRIHFWRKALRKQHED